MFLISSITTIEINNVYADCGIVLGKKWIYCSIPTKLWHNLPISGPPRVVAGKTPPPPPPPPAATPAFGITHGRWSRRPRTPMTRHPQVRWRSTILSAATYGHEF
uniref:Uncharacterized protein n=1 Tax=Triticum urartu TaxID=4572 RepID=A0A8R7TUY4_TRIUA